VLIRLDLVLLLTKCAGKKKKVKRFTFLDCVEYSKIETQELTNITIRQIVDTSTGKCQVRRNC
jgi:hypothetical protein